MSIQNPRTRFNKLTLKRNKMKVDSVVSNVVSQSLESIVLEDSFDRVKAQAEACVKSPIVINDSSEMSNLSLNDDLPKVTIRKCPSKFGNASFNCTQSDTSITELPPSRPSMGGWSPAQSIICATPRYKTMPSTPKDKANESMEQCSIKKIQQSQKKLLNDLYGEVWKSIPKLFKPTTTNDLDVVAKKLQFNDQDKEKENIREAIAITKQLYLTDSDAKHKVKKYQDDTEKKSKKRLYTVVPSTPDLTKLKNLKNTKCKELSTTPDPVKKKAVKVKSDVNTTGKKLKGKSVTELVEIMKDKFITESDKISYESDKFRSESDKISSESNKFRSDSDKLSSETNKFRSDSDKLSSVSDKLNIDSLVRRVKNIQVSPVNTRMTFVGSLADNVPSYRCHTEAINYRDNYKSLKEKLTRRLFEEFNETVFGRELDNDMSVTWDTKLRSTAGTTTNRLIKNSKGERIRSSSIKLSVKVLDNPERLRDTLIHELCHAATWVIDHELKAGHGPIWKKWAKRALKVYPELGEISRCHDMVIHFKYTYKCTRCGYSIQRHSKSIDITKKCCGYCRGTFEIVLNRKNKDGAVVSTPARKGEVNGFALYVKQNYGSLKTGRSHAQVMKVLGEQFSSNRNIDRVGSGV